MLADSGWINSYARVNREGNHDSIAALRTPDEKRKVRDDLKRAMSSQTPLNKEQFNKEIGTAVFGSAITDGKCSAKVMLNLKFASGTVRIWVIRCGEVVTLEVIDPALARPILKTELETALAPVKELVKIFNDYEFAPEDQVKLKSAGEKIGGFEVHLTTANADTLLEDLKQMGSVHTNLCEVAKAADKIGGLALRELSQIIAGIAKEDADIAGLYDRWLELKEKVKKWTKEGSDLDKLIDKRGKSVDVRFEKLLRAQQKYRNAERIAKAARHPLDHKKFLDMLIDEMEDKYIELLEGTRAHTSNIDAYIKRLTTALDDDFNTQFYQPAFRQVRSASRAWDVQLGQVETTSILANDREFAKVSPQATMEFDLPKRDILITEAMKGAKAAIDEYGALMQDPSFLALTKMYAGAPTSSPPKGVGADFSSIRNVLPGMSSGASGQMMAQGNPSSPQIGAAFEALIPDPAVYKFETGTGYEIRPVIQPDGQAVAFHLNYMYTTNVREPVRADEKHLGRVKRHFIDTDVQLSNYELREVSRYTVALKASRTSRGVPLLEDIPLAGVLFRPLPSQESSLQQNIILAQATIFPTLFDLMGLRWAPAVADLDPLRVSNAEFVVRSRNRALMNRVFDQSSGKVDEFLRIPEGERRTDLYRSQETIPVEHPNGYRGPGLNLRDSQLKEGYPLDNLRPNTMFAPGKNEEGSSVPPRREIVPPRRETPPANAESPNGVEVIPTPAPNKASGLRLQRARPSMDRGNAPEARPAERQSQALRTDIGASGRRPSPAAEIVVSDQDVSSLRIMEVQR